MGKRSLKGIGHGLSNATAQLEVLNAPLEGKEYPRFKDQVANLGYQSFNPLSIDTLQVNLGKMCNQVCKHCHVDAGPDRQEIMTKTTMKDVITAIKESNAKTVDLTGGAPEMNPDFRWFVGELYQMKKHMIVRCNLTIILANPVYHDLPAFFRDHQVEVISSLPHFSARRTDAQRGEGVFGKSIKALQMLNEVGYGKEGSGLLLNLVYNPSGAFLPPDQASLERDFKQKLKSGYNIEFNQLFAITNMPISRFLDYLISSGNYETYMDKLIEAFNPAALARVMCRNTLSVSWDGFLYDCDFNQMLAMKVENDTPQHISAFDQQMLLRRKVQFDQHCYGCTAGSGSSCGGEVV